MSDSATPWTAAHQAPLSMRFPRQEYWSGLPFPSPGNLPNPGIKPASPAMAGGLFTTEPPGKPSEILNEVKWYTFFFLLLYNIALVLPYINMHPPQVYTCSPSRTPSTSLPVLSLWVIPVHQLQASCILHQTWTGNSFLVHQRSYIWYYTCFNAILPNHPPHLSHRVQKTVLFICISLLSRIQGCRYHLSKFHIYALVYCIGVFLSGLLHSV